MSKKLTPENEDRFQSLKRGLWIATFAAMALTAVLWCAIQLESFLIRDPQFMVALPPDPGDESPALEILGVTNSARSNIAAVFQKDYGHSLYMVPLRQRRDDILRLHWIQDASVTRVWPNRLQVRVTERQPIAFVRLDGEESMPLLDIDGNFLPRESQAALDLPVATGITRAMDGEQRRARAQRIAKLMRDAGELAKNISDVDTADPDNLKVMQEANGTAVTLIIGNRHFKRRLEKFRLKAEDLLRREPGKTIFDLRHEGSIFQRPPETAQRTEAAGPGE
ncbi:MAG: FtsQ-type POTRA domain-containing protein [Acidobacteria bacterium]|nr:FtsQ-type POTRA domain-containing protein [Acidobacteriota bacterium]